MKKITSVFVAILAATMLFGCNGGSSETLSDDELVTQALNTGSIALISDGNTTKQLSAVRTNVLTRQNLILSNQISIRGAVVSLSWEASPPDSFDFQSAVDNQQTVVLTYPSSVNDAPATAILTVTATKNEVSDSFDYHLELLPPALTNLNELRNTSNNTNVVIQGYVTGFYDDWDNFFVQQDDFAITVRGTTSYFNNPDNETFTIGEFVRVYGRYTISNGWHIINNVTKAKTVAAPIEAEEPIVRPINEEEWNNDLSDYTGARVSVSGLKYQSGTITYAAYTSSTIMFKLGDVNVELRVPFNQSETVKDDIKAFIDGLEINDEVDFSGHLGWNNKPQLFALSVDNFTFTG
jgi:hypothetical protein